MWCCVSLVSHHFGYGLLDVAAMVDVARNWTRVPEQHRCEITSRHASRSISVVCFSCSCYIVSDKCYCSHMLHRSCPAVCLNHYIINACNIVTPASLFISCCCYVEYRALVASIDEQPTEIFLVELKLSLY